MNSKSVCATAVLLSTFVALAMGSSACSSSSDESVGARVEVTGKTSAALSAASITGVHGTYGASCQTHSSADPWVVDLTNTSNTTLAVVKNDTACRLSVTGLDAAGTSYATTTAIPMNAADTFASTTASAFAPSGGPTMFYANAKIDSLAYDGDFLISVVVSGDTSTSTTSGGNMTFGTRSAGIASSDVPAPNYTLSLANFTVARDADDIVDSVSGYATLVPGAVTGEDYAISDDANLDGSTSMADIETAFAAASPQGPLSGLVTLRLPATSFDLAGGSVSDGIERTVIIRHTDLATGAPSYELISVTFVLN